jgi:aryl-alcohol dehydrogenase-like predicted oxidoreductase
MDLSARVTRYTADLAVKALWGIMFHSFDSLKKNEHELPALTALKKSEVIGHVGVSVYTNAELEQAIAYAEIDFIQFPFNVLDNVTQRGALMRKAKTAGKIVHTRSAFLQGLFMKDLNAYPAYLDPLKKYIGQLSDIARDAKRTLESLCLPYVLNQPDIDKVIIGVDTSDQLKRNIEVSTEVLPVFLRERIDAIKVNEVELLYPMNWK